MQHRSALRRPICRRTNSHRLRSRRAPSWGLAWPAWRWCQCPGARPHVAQCLRRWLLRQFWVLKKAACSFFLSCTRSSTDRQEQNQGRSGAVSVPQAYVLYDPGLPRQACALNLFLASRGLGSGRYSPLELQIRCTCSRSYVSSRHQILFCHHLLSPVASWLNHGPLRVLPLTFRQEHTGCSLISTSFYLSQRYGALVILVYRRPLRPETAQH